MDRCRVCGSIKALDRLEYLEECLPGLEDEDMVLRVIIIFCNGCGWSERHSSRAVPVPA